MRLIDADKLLGNYKRVVNNITNNILTAQTDYAQGARDVMDDILNAPTVDAVPVVRCKDCTYCSHFTDGHLECRLLYNLKPVATTYCQMEENDFCSYGKEKEIIK